MVRYVNAVKRWYIRFFQIEKYYLRGKIAEINKEYDIATEHYKQAYETYDKEINKYISLQLGNRNIQYNMQQLKN